MDKNSICTVYSFLHFPHSQLSHTNHFCAGTREVCFIDETRGVPLKLASSFFLQWLGKCVRSIAWLLLFYLLLLLLYKVKVTSSAFVLMESTSILRVGLSQIWSCCDGLSQGVKCEKPIFLYLCYIFLCSFESKTTLHLIVPFRLKISWQSGCW